MRLSIIRGIATSSGFRFEWSFMAETFTEFKAATSWCHRDRLSRSPRDELSKQIFDAKTHSRAPSIDVVVIISAPRFLLKMIKKLCHFQCLSLFEGENKNPADVFHHHPPTPGRWFDLSERERKENYCATIKLLKGFPRGGNCSSL